MLKTKNLSLLLLSSSHPIMGKDEDFSSGHGKSSPGAEFIDSNTSSFLAPNKAHVNNKRKRSSPVTVPVALSMYDNELHSHASKKETSRLYKAVPEDHEILESGILHTTKSGQEGRGLQHMEVETKRGMLLLALIIPCNRSKYAYMTARDF